MSISELDSNTVSLIVAILALCGTIVGGIIVSVRDMKKTKLQGDETRCAVNDVKADTSDAKPKIDSILENSKETNKIMTRQIEPSLKEFETVSSKINDIHKDMEYKQKLKNDVSPTLYDKDKFLTGIERLYEDNAKLVSENYNLKAQLTESEVRIKVLESENKQLRTHLSPTDYNNALTQEFITE